jgi:hypothetical protein
MVIEIQSERGAAIDPDPDPDPDLDSALPLHGTAVE